MRFSRLEIGNRPKRVLKNTHMTVKTVCAVCNNGWMSGLESKIIPILTQMFDDQAVSLGEVQQKDLAVWVTKMTFLLDSTKGREAARRFYRKEDAGALRVTSEIPQSTKIWVGRIDTFMHRHIGATEIRRRPEKNATEIVRATTLMNEHFVAQVVTHRIDPPPSNRFDFQVEPRRGDWDSVLSSIWPIQQPIVRWPPPCSFTADGSTVSFRQACVTPSESCC
jgi:hypothetical protein